MFEDCIHGLNPTWCAECSGDKQTSPHSGTNYGYYGGESKQDLLNELCDELGLPREPIGVGSSLPSHVFETAARQAGVPIGSMPEIGEAIAVKAGLAWGADCDSRGSLSGGGSTVTREGLRLLVDGLRRLQ